MDRGFVHRFLDAFTGFLLVAAHVAFVSSFLPLIAMVIPSAFLPVGSLSVPLIGFLYLYFWSMEIASVAPPYGPPLGLVLTALALAAAFKALVYGAAKRNKVLGVSAAWVLLAYTVVILLLHIWSYLSSPAHMIEVSWLLRYIASALLATIPADLTGLSYVKFRDAVKGEESPKWVPALVALWTALLVVFLVELLPQAAAQACYEPHHGWRVSLSLYIGAPVQAAIWFAAALPRLIRGRPGALLSTAVALVMLGSPSFCSMYPQPQLLKPAAPHVAVVIALATLQVLYAALYVWLRVLRRPQAK